MRSTVVQARPCPFAPRFSVRVRRPRRGAERACRARVPVHRPADASAPTASCSRPTRRRATIYAVDLGDGAATRRRRRHEDDCRRSISRSRRSSAPTAREISVDRSRGPPEDPQRVRVGDARPGRRREGRRCSASTAPARSTSSTSPKATTSLYRTRRRIAELRAQRASQVDHRHGVHGRHALRRRPVERGVRVEAAVDVRIRSRRSTAAPASRSSTATTAQFETRSPVYTFVPYTVRQHAAPDRRLPLHAAREVPGRQPEAGREGSRHDDRRARRRQPADRHDALQEGRAGVPADVEHQPRRDEDSDRSVRLGAGHHARA